MQLSYNAITKGLSLQAEFAAKLPIFCGLQQEEIAAVLSNARVREFKKNTLLFIEGEKVQYFYVVLSGKIKLFKNNSDGQELILRIAVQQDTMSVATALFNSHFIASAKIIADTKLLIIPIVDIKKYLTTNSNLSANLMRDIADTAQDLVKRLEELALKSAKERVCWFLLSLLMQNNHNIKIQLPYDKATIASYLSMRPETFSRILHDLQDGGYLMIKRQHITLSSSSALSKFLI